MTVLNAQTSTKLTTNATHLTSIPGLTLTLPEGVGILALVILNLPNPYAEGINFPGALLGISVNGTTLPVQRVRTTYGIAQPANFNRTPTTLVAAAQGRKAADRAGALVRRMRQHRHHRQPGDAERHKVLIGIGVRDGAAGRVLRETGLRRRPEWLACEG